MLPEGSSLCRPAPTFPLPSDLWTADMCHGQQSCNDILCELYSHTEQSDQCSVSAVHCNIHKCIIPQIWSSSIPAPPLASKMTPLSLLWGNQAQVQLHDEHKFWAEKIVIMIFAYLNKCNTLVFTTGLPFTSCKIFCKGFAKALRSCYLSACQMSLNINL